jgi:hypothetical protein
LSPLLLGAAACWPTAVVSAGECVSERGFINEQLVQAGWWFRTLQGSPDKVAQYQDLESSPFWSVESLRSDSIQTVDFFAAGLDQEANDFTWACTSRDGPPTSSTNATSTTPNRTGC